MRILIFFFLAFCISSETPGFSDITGDWINSDNDAHIRIFNSNGKYFGNVIWMKNPIDSITGKPQLDKLNKDPLLQKRPVMNLIVLKNLEYDEALKEWKGGTIYNPKSGSSYDVFCKMSEKNILEMHFYMTFRSFGKVFLWKRIVK
ncbi:hypothetical protein BH09BAC5_BH09BAC5_26350 [soil metagenome]